MAFTERICRKHINIVSFSFRSFLLPLSTLALMYLANASDSDGEGDGIDGSGGESNHPPVTMAGVGPPPAGPECLVQAVLMEVLVILVSSGDKQADRAVVEAVWELLHEFDAMCRLLSNVRSPCLPLAKASMQLLTKMHHSKRFSIGPRSVLQVSEHVPGGVYSAPLPRFYKPRAVLCWTRSLSKSSGSGQAF